MDDEYSFNVRAREDHLTSRLAPAYRVFHDNKQENISSSFCLSLISHPLELSIPIARLCWTGNNRHTSLHLYFEYRLIRVLGAMLPVSTNGILHHAKKNNIENWL